MDERNNRFDFDFTPIGQAIKKARKAKGMTREQLSGIIGYAPRHIQSIENEGQYPSIELFIQLITMFDLDIIHCGDEDDLKALANELAGEESKRPLVDIAKGLNVKPIDCRKS